MWSTRYFCPISLNFSFVNSFSKNTQIPNFIKTRPAGAELFLVERWTDERREGRTDMTKLIVAFRNFAKAPKN
jgi:hypothetical protein